MKKFFYISMAALLALSAAVSCQKDEGEPIKYAEDGKTPLPKMVDLGVMKDSKGVEHHILWASCNLGAAKEDEPGNYYAWGEREPRTSFTEDNYSYKDFELKTLPVDAAKEALKGNWRMPTQDEFDALVRSQQDDENFTWERKVAYDNDGQPILKGWRVTSKQQGTKGNSVFFPAAGYYYSKEVVFRPTFHYYWSSTNNSLSPEYPYTLYLYKEKISVSSYSVFASDGCPIRPVCDIVTE